MAKGVPVRVLVSARELCRGRSSGASFPSLAAAALAFSGLLFAAGAVTESAAKFNARQRSHWAFQPLANRPVPQVARASWFRNPIDAFVLSALEAKNLTPSPEASRVELLRRASFDLIGLPPTTEEIESFVNDPSPRAYEKVIDRLLDSPRYGERWGRHWLDLARYADSDGYKADHTRPNVWRYRDYVIRSFNADKPYDRFIREQIAGDELYPNDFDAVIATGFNRHYPDEYNAQNLRQRHQDTLNDITDTTGAVFLGLTFGCARCHDHKFDPILQADYYKLQAFFANVSAVDDLPLLPPDRLTAYRLRLAVWEMKTKDIRAEMAALLEPGRKKLVESRFMAYSPEVQAVVRKPAAERTPLEQWMFHRAQPFLTLIDEQMETHLKGAEKERYEKLQAELQRFAPLHPGELPVASYMTELGRETPGTSTLAVGLVEKPLKAVEPGYPSILNSPAPVIEPRSTRGSEPATSGRRTALANWLADPANPLTPRVMVNRIWAHHFGKGIAATPSDFGIMGSRPSHPELLDWLSAEFVRSGWSVKRMHRLMLTSSAYRQSSAFREDAAAVDQDNRLLWRFPRQRLDAEVIRDSSLHVSGLLDLRMGGPGVFPELPPGMPAPRGGWGKTADAGEGNRRSVYIFVRRNSRYPILEVFDLATAQETCPRRNNTTTAPQALSLLNSKLSRDWAEALAARVIREAGPDFAAQVDRAYRLAYSRAPEPGEKDLALTFLGRQLPILSERERAGELLSRPAAPGADPLRAAALVDFCQALLNSNEFVYVN